MADFLLRLAINPFIKDPPLSKSWASAYRGRSTRVNAKSLNLALFVFVAITITNAALVDYRSVSNTLSSVRSSPSAGIASYERISTPAIMTFLHARKYAGFDSQTVEFAPKRSSWRGMTKSIWTESGLCCGVFELLIRMKGGRTRVKLLRSIEANPSNKLQLADSIGIDWKAVDRHVNRLVEHNLVRSYMTVGTSTVFCITDKGKKVLALIENYHNFEPPICKDNA